MWQRRGIYHSQIKARSSSMFAFTLGWEFMSTGGTVCAAHLVTQQSAKGCTTRQSIVFLLSISTRRMSFRQNTNGVADRYLQKCKIKETTSVTVVWQLNSSMQFIKFPFFKSSRVLINLPGTYCRRNGCLVLLISIVK